MITHNSAKQIGGPMILFITGYFAPWWQAGVLRATDWTLLWPIGLISGIILSVRKMTSKVQLFFSLLPLVYLILESTQVPFTRYFIIILPFIYLSFANLIALVYDSLKCHRKE
jgi:hypothetical protein